MPKAQLQIHPSRMAKPLPQPGRCMRYHAIACDYDGTLADGGGTVHPDTIGALRDAKLSGRRLLLVTGRELEDLAAVFPQLGMFDRIVGENGAVVYDPASRIAEPLAEPPSPRFVSALIERGVTPLSVGKVIVATRQPNEKAVLEVIRDLGLELQVIFNKGAVMVLPSAVDKGVGLVAALAQLGVSPRNCVGVGDAENDHAFLGLCGCSVAVANALPGIRERVDLVTDGSQGAGVRELLERLVADDLQSVELRDSRQR